MSLLLIIVTWLVVPSIAIWLGVTFYVPHFLATQKRREQMFAADELAVRRAMRTPTGSRLARHGL